MCFSRIKASQILHSSWCNNSCCAFQVQSQGNFYSFNHLKVSFSSYTTPTHKKNLTTGSDAYLTDSQYCTHLQKKCSHLKLVTEWTSLGLKEVWLLLLVNISSKLSTINYYFKIPILADSSQFPMSSLYHLVLPEL